MAHTQKTNPGNYFEDFAIGQQLHHATPRTVTTGDTALYTALTGNRFAVASADSFAQTLGYPGAPIDDLLVFHVVFGKSVPDISLNAVANLGYAEVTFGAPVYSGDTLSAVSEVIALKQNSNGKTGVVYVRTTGENQNGETVLSFIRWVMVNKRDPAAPAPATTIPETAEMVAPRDLQVPACLTDVPRYDTQLAGSPHLFDDYAVGEKIDHVDGMTIEEAEHQLATRLYQNTAKVHFDAKAQAESRFGKRLIYGGMIISLARALSFNGLANAFRIGAINGGRHVNPCFAGDTIYAWSEVLDTAPMPERSDLGALRLRTIASRDATCADHPTPETEPKGSGRVLLDLDYWVLMPRRD